ncbi:GntR family transcriptional regulator [bacterium]|nr:GntR family transcriptional regulator [bacterium]
MTYFVDGRSGVPIFRQLMDQIKLNIAGGVLGPGDELPSVRQLSVPLGVNPMTISKAYNLLVHEGVLIRRPGLPLIVADLGPGELEDRRMEQLTEALRPVVHLVRQLGIDPDGAQAAFKDLLEDEDRMEKPRRRGQP